MRGIYNNANTVVFYSSGGYNTSLPLAYIKEAKILLAYKMNGVKPPEDHGFPFRVVAESKTAISGRCVSQRLN